MDRNLGSTKWSRIIPKNICIFIWRARIGRIPCRMVLDRMGLDLDSELCPRCGETTETVDHALVSCSEVKKGLAINRTMVAEGFKWSRDVTIYPSRRRTNRK